MDTIQIIRVIMDIITAIVAISLFYIIIRRHPEKLANRILASSILLVAFYPISLLIMDIIAKEWASQVFLRMGMILLLFGVIFMHFTYQIMVHSTTWIKTSKEPMIYLIIGTIISIFLVIFKDLIEVVSIEPVNNHVNLPFISVFLLFIFYLTLKNVFNVYGHGIKKTEGNLKMRLQFFVYGLISFIMAMIFVIIGTIFKDSSEFDILILVALNIGLILLTIGFLKKE